MQAQLRADRAGGRQAGADLHSRVLGVDASQLWERERGDGQDEILMNHKKNLTNKQSHKSTLSEES